MHPFLGLRVAVRGDEVLVIAPSANEVLAWLERHRRRAQSLFRVVHSEQVITGAARNETRIPDPFRRRVAAL